MDIYEEYKKAQDKATFFRNCSYVEKKALIEKLTEIPGQAEYKDLISRLNEKETDEFISEMMAEKEMINARNEMLKAENEMLKAENVMLKAEKQYLIAQEQWAKAAERRYAFIDKRAKEVNRRIKQDVDSNGRPRNSDELARAAVNMLKEYVDTGYFDYSRELKEYGLIQDEKADVNREATNITGTNNKDAPQDMESLEVPQDMEAPKGVSRK